jgi:predicted amidohydrolase YtcJ
MPSSRLYRSPRPHNFDILGQQLFLGFVSDKGIKTSGCSEDTHSTLLSGGFSKNGWIVGFGYDPSRVADNPHLTKHILGEISEDVPIFVLNQSGHIAYVNSKALKEAGMNESTALSGFQRDPKNPKNGLTGVIFEEEAISEVALIIPPPAEDLVQQWVENIFKNCASRGCTTIYEVQLGAFGLGEIDLIKEASQGPNVPVNLYGAYSEKILAAKPQLKPETLGGIHMQVSFHFSESIS